MAATFDVTSMAMVLLLRIGALQRLANTKQLCRCCARQSQAVWTPSATRRPLGGLRSLSTTSTWRSEANQLIEADEEVRSDEQIKTDVPIQAHKQNKTDTEDSLAFKELQAELETYQDIREYLRKWQENNPQHMDPISEPKIDDLRQSLSQQFGTMLNDRGAKDSLWDTSSLVQQEDFDTSEDFEGDHLEPGDLVARLGSDGTFRFAIYVQSVDKQRHFYTDRGNWRICSMRELDYVVKGFAPPELLAPIQPYFPDSFVSTSGQIQTVPEGGLPRPLGASLLVMMGEFGDHLVDFYRVNAHLLDHLHDAVADNSEHLRLTLEEMAMKVLGLDESELNSVNLFAVHKTVRSHPFLIEKDSRSLFNALYLVQSKRTAKIVKRVVQWVHEHQEYLLRAVTTKDNIGFAFHPMQSFIRKAQRLLRLSRKSRSPTIMGCVGPSSDRFPPGRDGKPMVYREVLTEQFSQDDQVIIEFLQLYALPSVTMPSGDLRSAASHIMRETGMYKSLGLSVSSTRLFLQELGVVAPWENLGLLDQCLLLPGHGMSLTEDMKWEEIQERCENISEPLPDSMKDLRKDWGDLPVYCVDDATAQEIDDGVSLERVPGSDDTFWVRVHVANPTAFLKPDDPSVEYAGSRLATTYVPERTYPIFPTALTQKHFSLAAGRPTLTFSAKMNFQGEILDIDVVNGTVQNVISFTHGTLRNFLKDSAEESPTSGSSASSLTVGGKYTPHSLPQGRSLRETLSAEDKETFTILRQLMLGFRTQRQKNGAMDMTGFSDRSVSVQLGTIPAKPYDMQVTGGRYIIGDPIIQLRMQELDPHEVPDMSKENLISLIMNLAGHIAGRFCAERNIPAIFDGTWYDPEYKRVTNENIAEFGGREFFGLALPKAVSASEPIHHHVLGLDAYVKSTSPLRRYTDIIAHYQIEAALRFEHDHGRPFNALTDTPTSTSTDPPSPSESTSEPPTLLPFSKLDLDNYIFTAQPLKTRLREVSSFSTQHWACMLLFRAFYFGECELPASFPVLLRMPRIVPAHEGIVYSGTIANLGVDCVVSIPKSCVGFEDVDISGLVQASIVAVDMGTLSVKMKAERLIKPFQRIGEWA